MRRYSMAVGASALLALAGTALGQINIQQPVDGDNEFASQQTIVEFDIPDGLAAADGVVDGEALEISIDFLDADGNQVFPGPDVDLVGGATNYVNATGNPGLQIDLGGENLSAFFGNASVVGIRVKARTAGGDAGVFVEAAFDAMDETMDEILTAVKAGAEPELTDVFLNDAGDAVFFVFSKSLNNGNAANDINHTVIGNIDSTDVQIDTSDDFDGTEGAPAGLSNFAFLGGSNNTTIMADRNDGTSDLEVGTWVRPTYDDAMPPVSMNDFLDITGLGATDTAVQARTIEALAIESATVIETVTGAGAVADAVRVTYNLPLNPGDLGDDAFYGDALQLNGADSDVDITGIAADPDDPNSVLLDVTAGGNDLVFPDGLDADGDGYSIATDTGAGDVPSSIFDTDDFGDDQTVTADDGVAPSIQFWSYHDMNGDGELDAVAAVFDEPVSGLPGTGDFELNKIDATVNPFDLIDPLSGDLVDADVVADGMADNNEIDVEDVASGDVDVDTTSPSRLFSANAVVLTFSPDAVDWNNDGTVGDEMEAVPGTGGPSAIEADVASEFDIDDANGNSATVAAAAGIAVNTDRAPAVAFSSSYLTGDNFNVGGFRGAPVGVGRQVFVETDGVVGDNDDNNTFQTVFSEMIDAAGLDETLISWGAGVDDAFEAGDPNEALGPDNNIFQIVDSNANGFAPGDTVNFAAGNGLDDGFNEVTGDFEAPDGTSPFVPEQTDINGDDAISAFVFDTDGDGRTDEVRLFPNTPVDEDTVQVGDFTWDGNDFDSVSVNEAGTSITLVLPGPDSSKPNAGSNVAVVYTAPDNNDAMDSKVIAGTDGDNVYPGLASNITATPFPTPDTDTDNLAIQDVRGSITEDGEAVVGVGAKVFGFALVPVPKMLNFTQGQISYWVDDESSLEAFWNFLFGFEDHLYAENDGGTFTFSNSIGGHSGGDEVFDISVNASNLDRVSFQGQGRSFTSGDSQPERNLRIQNGTVRFSWAPLKSNNGSTFALKNGGYDFGGAPVASRAVVTDDTGGYALHVSAPIVQFGGGLSASGWPIGIVVERSTGERIPVTSTVNAVDGNGPVLFNALQRTDDLDDEDATDRSGGSNITFDINLSNQGVVTAYSGWNLTPFNRVSGFATQSGNVPTVPTIHGEMPQVVTDVDIPFARPFNQFVFFEDNNGDGEYTSADDGGDQFDALFYDINCFDHMRFVMTDRGIQIGNNITALVGGYGAALFNGENDPIGIFQFGAAGSADTIFTGNFNSSQTMNWFIFTAPNANADPAAFLDDNSLDALIEFNRTSASEVDVNTTIEGAGIDDVTEVSAGQAYFGHRE